MDLRVAEICFLLFALSCWRAIKPPLAISPTGASLHHHLSRVGLMETLVNDCLTQISGSAAADKEDTMDHILGMSKMNEMFASSFRMW